MCYDINLKKTKKSLIQKTIPRYKCIILSGKKTNQMSAFFFNVLTIPKRKIFCLINHFLFILHDNPYISICKATEDRDMKLYNYVLHDVAVLNVHTGVYI